MSADELRFALLGPLRAWRGDAELDLGSPQQRGVLAVFLLAEGRQVGLDVLLDALWGQDPPPSAVSTVRTYVSRLRKALRGAADADQVIGLADGYALPVRPGMTDLEKFQRTLAEAEAAGAIGETARAAALLREGLTLWQGAPLAGVPGRWAASQRVRLEDLRLAALEDRLTLDLDLGAHAAACAELRELVDSYPMRERFTELLMLALYRSGRQGDALAAFDASRRLLAEELGVDPGPALREMHERILRTDQTLLGTATVKAQPQARPPSPAVRPAQLPADLHAFAGRQAELARLDQVLDDNERRRAVAIAVIGGMGGIGKTTLALHWAHKVADRFPDGQLYVNLRGFDPGGSAMPAGEALRGFLTALGIPEHQIPEAPDAQTGLYRSLLYGRRILIVLDNARDVEQVRPLLPGTPDCAAVITSRSRLGSLITAYGASPIALQPLTPEQARTALARRLGERRLVEAPGALEQIVEQCAGLPLALAIVAARATTYHDLPLTVIADELLRARTRLSALAAIDHETDVRAVFSWSYRQLSNPAGTLFLLLSLHPGPDFPVGAAASLAASSPADARALLDELAAAHLITEHRPGRYTQHDLIRAYATELSDARDTEQDRTPAFSRLADYYLHTAHGAQLRLQPVFRPADPGKPRPGVNPEPLTDHAAAMEWFAAEWHVLKALIAASAVNHEFRPYTWQLALRLQQFCQRQGHWQDWRSIMQTALDAAEAENDLAGQAYTRRSLAGAYRFLGRLDDALAELHRVRHLFDELGYTVEHAYLHSNFSNIYRLQRRYDKAAEHAGHAYDLFDAMGNLKGMSIALENLGSICDELGRYEDAISNFERAVAICRETNDLHGEAYCWVGLGGVYRHQGKVRQAAETYRRGIEMARQMGDRDSLAEALVGLGDVMLEVGDLDAAREAWREALVILDDLKALHGKFTAESVRARLADGGGRFRPGSGLTAVS